MRKVPEGCEVSTVSCHRRQTFAEQALHSRRVRFCEQKRADRAMFSTHRVSHPGPHEEPQLDGRKFPEALLHSPRELGEKDSSS